MSDLLTMRLEPPWRGYHVVTVAGELDRATGAELDAFLGRLTGKVVLDFAGVTVMDETAHAALLRAATRLDDLRLVNVRPAVFGHFERTGTVHLCRNGRSRGDAGRAPG